MTKNNIKERCRECKWTGWSNDCDEGQDGLLLCPICGELVYDIVGNNAHRNVRSRKKVK